MGTWAKTIYLMNWGPFRGEHTIELEPTSYGVSGENWAGKSRFLSAVPFALFGVNPERTEDEWITRGEPAGMVAVTLSNGERYERGRKRGKTTQAVLTCSDGATMQGGDVVSEEAARRIGLSRDDFFASCYFLQKRISRIVTMDPTPRVEIVSGWVGLERADRAIEVARTMADRCDEGVASAMRRRDQALAAAGALTLLGEDLAAVVPRLEREKEEAARELEAVKEAASSAVARRAAREYATVVERGKELKAELEALPKADDLRLALEQARLEKQKIDQERGALDQDRRRSLALAAGRFDGKCPVIGEECPARTIIEARQKEAGERAASLGTELAQSSAAAIEAEATWGGIAQVDERRRMLEQQLFDLRARARALKAEAGGVVASDETKLDDDATDARIEAATRTDAEARARLEQARRAGAELEEAGAQLEAALVRAKVSGAAAVVAERAKREVMKRSVGQIEQLANSLLAECEIDLSVAFQWEREGKGLAKNCGECGAGFPPSARVKVCERCGAARGPAMTDRLDLVLSSVSGAAEDLAGVAVQVAASSWLRRRRSAPWAAAFVDEPFGALTAKNRRALAQHLMAALLGPHGYEQAFVIAHQPDALAGAKRRIEVMPGPGGSRIVVV